MSTHEYHAGKRVHTGRHDVEAMASVGLSSGVSAIMPLSMTGFDFLSFWTDETLLPPYSRIAARFNKGWIGGRRQNAVVVS